MNPGLCAITAATSGLGRALSEKFAADNYSLILHARNASKLEVLCAELKHKFNIPIQLISGDLTDKSTLERLASEIIDGDCRVLVNNAGEPCPGLGLHELSASQIESLIKVNLEAPIYLSRSFYAGKLAPSAEKCDYTVININSIMALEPKPKRSVYSAVRAGLMGFTDAMFEEGKVHGVRFFGVYPSRIKTRPEYDYGMETEEVAAKIYDFFKKGSGPKLILDGRPAAAKKA